MMSRNISLRRIRRGTCALAVACAALGLSLIAKRALAQAPIRVQINEVIVPVTVTDDKGRFVSDLTQQDFRIFDEGNHNQMGDGGMMKKAPDAPVSSWTFYFAVDAIGAAIERVKAGGGKILNGPTQVPGNSWIINGQDPQGAAFSLVSGKQ